MFSTTGFVSNGKRSSIGPEKLNRVLKVKYVYSPLRQKYKYRILKKYNTTKKPTVSDRQDEREQILI